MSIERYDFKINAPLDLVWSDIVNLQEYEKWNPFVIRAAGTLDPGTEIDLVCLVNEDKEIRERALVLSYVPYKRLALEVRSNFKTWNIRIEVHERDIRSTDLSIVTEIKGLPLIGRGPSMEEVREGFERMADALNKRVADMAVA